MSWSRAFHIPIPLPDGRVLRTLHDAGEYIQELPKAIHQRPEWQIAAERLLEAVEGKSLMFAEAAIRKAVNAGKPAPEPTPLGSSQQPINSGRRLFIPLGH
jgi:anaerobic glycerol-3-phosphate dehydrogenase